MVEFKRAGYFRERKNGRPEEPSLIELRGQLDPKLVEPMVQYLRAGGLIAVSTAMVDDVLSGAQKVAMVEVRSDGVWVWPGELAYYVEKYAVGLPPEFIAHVVGRNWQAPVFSREALAALATAIRNWGQRKS
jgi:hypothetical protein